MYPITNEVKALFEAEQRQILRITGTDKNGVAINITDEDIVLDSFNIDRCSCNGEKLEVGTAIASEMTFKLDNFDGRYNSVVFEGTELFVEIGIADWTQDNPTVNWIPCGYFTSDEQPRSLSTITVHALDRMTRFDKIPPAAVPWTTKAGMNITTESGAVIEFLSNVRFPITVANLVVRVCKLCGVPLATVPSRINSTYTIQSMPTLQQDVTFRNLIQWCAGIMCSNAWIDWDGNLQFSWNNSAYSYISTTANRFSSDIYENDISFSGVSYTNIQGVTIVSGSAGYTLDLTGNYLAANGLSTILPNIRTYINNFAYRPFSASVINAPYLWPMDRIQVRDKTNITRQCLLTNVNFGINSTTELKSKGETVQTNSGTAPSGVTKEQGFLIEQAYEVATNLDKSLDQEGIFNRLTNNGEAQGVYIIDGQVYVNMSYARSGTLVLGGLNNTNGLLKVLDANGNEIGHWGNDGIVLNKGSININNGAFQVSNSGILNATGATINGILYTVGVDHFDFPIALYMGHGSMRYYMPNQDPRRDSFAYIEAFSLDSTSLDRGTLSIVGQYGVYIGSDGQPGYPDPLVMIGGELEAQGDVKILNSKSLYITNGNATIQGNLTVNGTKSRSVVTDQYADRLLYCYETPSPLFGDVGEGKIGDDGKCYIWIDPVFAQTITTTQYQVFLQRYGNGECWVSERKGSYFVVEGTPGMAFGWELKAKQRDFDQKRLEPNDDPFTVPNQTYGEDAARHIDELKKERIPV